MLPDQLLLDLAGGPAGLLRLGRLADRVGGNAQAPEGQGQVVSVIRVRRMLADQHLQQFSGPVPCRGRAGDLAIGLMETAELVVRL